MKRVLLTLLFLVLPVLLVVRPKGASLTLAAQLQGLKAFRTPHHIAGVLLNDCTETVSYTHLTLPTT